MIICNFFMLSEGGKQGKGNVLMFYFTHHLILNFDVNYMFQTRWHRGKVMVYFRIILLSFEFYKIDFVLISELFVPHWGWVPTRGGNSKLTVFYSRNTHLDRLLKVKTETENTFFMSSSVFITDYCRKAPKHHNINIILRPCCPPGSHLLRLPLFLKPDAPLLMYWVNKLCSPGMKWRKWVIMRPALMVVFIKMSKAQTSVIA